MKGTNDLMEIFVWTIYEIMIYDSSRIWNEIKLNTNMKLIIPSLDLPMWVYIGQETSFYSRAYHQNWLENTFWKLNIAWSY